ncbi:MAG: hypothetical protein ACLQM8_09305 [Limisphaerales bacterium]
MSVLGFFFGDSYHHRAQRDQWRPSTAAKNVISPINSYGTCFSCDGAGTRTLDCRCCDGSGSKTLDCRCGGTGSVTLDCRLCSGSGKLTLPARPCFTCQGSGRYAHGKCRRCRGTGCHKPECTVACRRCGGKGSFSVSCRKCDGRGSFSVTCRKCSGQGTFTVACRKCGGSGWHQF